MLDDRKLAELMAGIDARDEEQLAEMMRGMDEVDVAFFKGYIQGYSTAVLHLQQAGACNVGK